MITINEIAHIVNGTVAGDGEVRIKGLQDPASASEGDLTFAADSEQLKAAESSAASCVLTAQAVEDFPKTILKVDDIKKALTILYNAMLKIAPALPGNIHPSAVIDETAVMGKDVCIGPNVVIGRKARIGDNTVIDAGCVIGNGAVIGQRSHLFPRVTIYALSIIGNNVAIHAGSVIGADGFGYVPGPQGVLKVPQLGRTVIEDNVEIGANTCVDRGTFGNTVVGENTKIDNLVQIAHNVKIGKHVLIAAQLGIGGSSSIGDNSMTGGQVGISDHIKVGKNVKLAAQAGIIRNVEDGATLFGYPARDAREVMKKEAATWWIYRHIDIIKAAVKRLSEGTSGSGGK